ncbi:hypothetical protein DEU56DRAFT_795301 [Suillus clintonianus]|uniref:uncharacterized protein n=1 Tax=Suillus clintonianus TaxID=1904413 RepID=UPI001B865D35|nr:uncharacterized protein DEU56DRAFT_795301 [Suillus clintonianus]KAG2141876.1 hypothetical protein DEU56DRAFT_795301 [Suillus clintonianus]
MERCHHLTFTFKPGHHCEEDSPSGFCLVKNVVIGAAHAPRVWDSMCCYTGHCFAP